MELLTQVLATSFVVSTVDYFRYLGTWRIAVAAAAATCFAALGGLGPQSPAEVAAAAFGALTAIAVLDRVVSVRASRR